MDEETIASLQKERLVDKVFMCQEGMISKREFIEIMTIPERQMVIAIKEILAE